MLRKGDRIWAFTDGACSGNPGPGGWAFITRDVKNSRVVEKGGYLPKTTNNQMELEAVSQALLWVQKNVSTPTPITVFSDSTYVIQGITKWIHNWRKNGWVKSDQQAVANREYWERLFELTESFGSALEFRHVKGHASNDANNRVDEIAVAFSTLQAVDLYDGSEEGYELDLATSVADVLSGDGAPGKTKTSSPKIKKSGPAYYLSFVGGKIARHQTWADCENAVKGKSGAKFKKIVNPIEEVEWLKSWGAKS